MEGIFTISLDFELHWGVFDKKDVNDRISCYQNTIKLIPQMLQLFSEYDVHVTWATVGSLFAANANEWNELKPVAEPEYENEKYSAYKWIKENGVQLQCAYFATESIKNILQYPHQELGTHTFSHYYCLEAQKKTNAFSEDLKAAQKAARKFNTNLVSLVFPRNQFNPYYLKACYEVGIKAVRVNPFNWFWIPVAEKGSTIIRKVFRTGDAYLPISNKRTSYSLEYIKAEPDEPLQIPASRFFRPWQPKYPFINKMKLQRVIKEINAAAIHKECYHLWCHPENFGDYPEQNIKELKVVLEEYAKCKAKHGMNSWNMKEYADNCRK